MNSSDQQQLPVHQNRQQHLAAAGGVAASGQMAYATSYQTTPMVATGAPATAVSSPTQLPTTFPPQQQLASYHQAQQFQGQQQQQQLQGFWANQMQEIEQTIEFKNHSLPLARIKKIMKADEDVRMISAEAPVIFAKACEMFILELTMRAWIHTEENKRRTLQKNDIAAAISRTDVFDFLVDIIPRDELKEEGLGIAKATIPLMGSPADAVPYYYVPQHNPQLDQAALYGGQQSRPPLSFMAWPQLHTQQQPPEQQPDDGIMKAEMLKSMKRRKGVASFAEPIEPPKKKLGSGSSFLKTLFGGSEFEVVPDPSKASKGKGKVESSPQTPEGLGRGDNELSYSQGLSFMASSASAAALGFVQNMISAEDLALVQLASDDEVNESMALNIARVMLWADESTIRSSKVRSIFYSQEKSMDELLAQHGELVQ